MSIVVAHGYSMMYTSQRQQKDEPAGPLADEVAPLPFQAATFGKGGVAPSSKRELNERYNSANDFDLAGIGDPAWDDAWPPVCWVKVGSKFYTWDGSEWVTIPLTEGVVMPGDSEGFPPGIPADEMIFMGRYPQTEAELATVTPNPDTYFATGTYVRLIGQGVGDQYFWNGSEWLPGVSDD